MRVGQLCTIVDEAEVDPSSIDDDRAKSMAILAIGGVCHHRGIEVRIHLPGRTAPASIDHGHYGVRQRPDLIAVLREESVESRNLIVPHLQTDANAASYGPTP